MHKIYYLSNATFSNLATPGLNGRTTFNPTNHVRSLIKLYFLRSPSSPFFSSSVSEQTRPYKWNVSLKLQQFKMKRLHHHWVARVNMKMGAQWTFFAVVFSNQAMARWNGKVEIWIICNWSAWNIWFP